MRSRLRRIRAGVGLKPHALLAVLALACGGDDLGGPAPVRGIAIISGSEVTDSAGTLLTAPLIVEVHDSSGALAPPGTLVRFEVVDTVGRTLLAPFSGGPYDVRVSRNINDARRTQVFVSLATIPGVVRVAITAPTLGVADTARFIVVPGGPAEIFLAPADTAIILGRSYTLRGAVRDKYRNARPEPIAWIGPATGMSVTSGGIVTATAVGRYRITGTAAGFTDSVKLSAVPPALLAVFDPVRSEVVTIELDGSNRRVRVAATDGGIGVRPRWLPGSDRIIYSTYEGNLQELRVVDAAGASLPFLSAPPPTMSHQADAAPSADGSWMYFAAYDTRCLFPDYCLFRSRLDGSSPELLGNDANPNQKSFRPSPSPDGKRVVFTTLSANPELLRVLDAETRTLMPWTLPGIFPQWSPVGDVIAYQEGGGELKLVNSDGTGARVLVPGPGFYREGGFSWSPDGQWLVRRGPTQFELVIVSTGEVLPIQPLVDLREPSWK